MNFSDKDIMATLVREVSVVRGWRPQLSGLRRECEESRVAIVSVICSSSYERKRGWLLEEAWD